MDTQRHIEQRRQNSKYTPTHHPLPMLEHQEEYLLAKHYRETGDKDDRERLVKSHLPLVERIAQSYRGDKLPIRYRGGNRPIDDMIAEGRLGLLRAVESYDPDRARLSTYATWWINAAIKEYLERNSSMVRPPSRRRPLKEDVSLDDGQDQIADDIANQDAARIEAGKTLYLRELLNEVMDRALSARERRVFQARRLDGNRLTLKELSSELGVSSERVRQIEVCAFEKVKEAAKSPSEIRRSKEDLRRKLASFYANTQPFHHGGFGPWVDAIKKRFPEATQKDRIDARSRAKIYSAKASDFNLNRVRKLLDKGLPLYAIAYQTGFPNEAVERLTVLANWRRGQ
jgi:RNA polymerase sigma-32 factor